MAKDKPKKLCKLMSKGKINKVAALAMGADHICGKCGRVSADTKNLCKPLEI